MKRPIYTHIYTPIKRFIQGLNNSFLNIFFNKTPIKRPLIKHQFIDPIKKVF